MNPRILRESWGSFWRTVAFETRPIGYNGRMKSRRSLLIALLLPVLAGCGDDSSTQAAAPCGCPDATDGGTGCDGGDAGAEAAADSSPESDSDTKDAGEDASPEAGAPDASKEMLRLMTYNIKHGELSSLGAIAEVIKAENADIVGLQEVDVDAERSGNVDQPHRLGQLTGMANLFRSALTLPDGGLYGLAVLSRFPLIVSEKVSLTSAGEQRILAIVDIDVNGTTVPFCITHLGLTASERTTQVKEILAKLEGKPFSILMGDMNATPDEGSMKSLSSKLTDAWLGAGSGSGYTIPSGTPTKRIDYVYLGSSWAAPVEAHVPVTEASDHRPVVVTLPYP